MKRAITHETVRGTEWERSVTVWELQFMAVLMELMVGFSAKSSSPVKLTSLSLSLSAVCFPGSLCNTNKNKQSNHNKEINLFQCNLHLYLRTFSATKLQITPPWQYDFTATSLLHYIHTQYLSFTGNTSIMSYHHHKVVVDNVMLFIFSIYLTIS